jgi:hypothetical protein
MEVFTTAHQSSPYLWINVPIIDKISKTGRRK